MRLPLLAAALVSAGFGCMNLQDGSSQGDPSAPASATAHPAFATMTQTIELATDDDRLVPYVVLDADTENLATIDAPAEWWRDGEASSIAARKSLTSEALAKIGVEGAHVRLYAEGGARCDAVLGTPFVLGRAWGLDEEVETDDVIGRVTDDAKGTRWEQTSGGRTLVAPLVGDACAHGKDEDAWVAASASTTSVRSMHLAPADAATSAQLLAQFRALPEWSVIAEGRRGYEDMIEVEHVAHWDDASYEPSISTAEIDGVRWGWVVASIGNGDGCGAYTASLGALFVDRGGRWMRVSASNEIVDVPSVAWVTPNGVAWTLPGGSLVRPEGTSTKLLSPQIAFHGCPC